MAFKMEETNRSVLFRTPVVKPPFTLAELKRAIPPHCFKKSPTRSISYLATDLIMAMGLILAIQFINTALPGTFNWIFWVSYWIAQGSLLFCMWVLVHECGHCAFTGYNWVDNFVGVFIHAWLLIPFFSWKYSHNRHHKNTGSVERDEVFVPKTQEEVSLLKVSMMNNPLWRLLWIIITLTVGWPSYFIFNATGRKYDRFASHFYPNSPIFVNFTQKVNVTISELAVFGAAWCLYKMGSACGFMWLLKIYGIPFLVLNGIAVLIIYLQHNHPALPHYTNEEWDWLRGALSTVDRDLGILLNHVFHHVTDTHVLHHLFSSIPHYHAVEATKAIKPILGQYYQFDGTPIYKALWREFKECVYVAPDSAQEIGILWFTNRMTAR